jgi:hypothetical protein
MNHLEKQKENRQKPKPPVIVINRPQTPEKIPEAQNLTITITNEESVAPAPKGLQIIINNSGRQVKEQGVNEENVSDNIGSTNPPKSKDTLRKQVLMKNTISKSVETTQKDEPLSVEQLMPVVMSPEKPPTPIPVSGVPAPCVDTTITTTAMDLPEKQENTEKATIEDSIKDSGPQARVSKKPSHTKTIAERIMALNESDRLKFLSKYESNYQENR